jgi:hypothetical protein
MSESESTLQRMQNTLTDNYQKATDSMSSVYNNASDSISKNYDTAYNTVAPVTNSINEQFNTLKDSVSNTVGEFSSKSVGEASSEFLESNSLIARFSFVLIVVIIFMILLRIGIYLVGYFSRPNENPYVVKGLLPGSNSVRVTQDPKISDSVTILRSNNQKTGIEFTWCIWLNISMINTSSTQIAYQHIFNKGDNNYGTDGIAQINNGPGMYLKTSNDPTLRVVMNTVSPTTPVQTVDINNIPLKKWFHVILRMQNNLMDVYINGVVTQRVTFPYVPKQNYQDVYVCQNNGISTGFSGNLSDLRYYDRALNIFQITNIVSAGPNLTTSGLSSATANYGSTYLSSMWYTNNM